MKKSKTIVGLLAHVDAGKTTLTESLLFNSGAIRKTGRVDHGDAFLDTDAMEKSRGITIFSKQARLSHNGQDLILLDTPGHSDFSPEMERTLIILDAAILLISASDGVTARVRVLWSLLKSHNIPVFVFVNKMDQAGADRNAVLEELKDKLDRNITAFDCPFDDPELQESLALCDEKLLDAFLSGENISPDTAVRFIKERKIFPCYFGSALKNEGVDTLLDGLSEYLRPENAPDEFGARVYKISRDSSNARLTWMKITGGSLKAKTLLSGEAESEEWSEKADQLRLYSGSGFSPASEVFAGDICAVTGLTMTQAGDGLGTEPPLASSESTPVLTYELITAPEVDVKQLASVLKLLQEEQPDLAPTYNEKTKRISVSLMGRVQSEILKHQLKERFDLDIAYGAPTVIYKETIANTVEGVGHFEPLRHYAEAHILIEPLPAGSGIEIETVCSVDELALNWQRLIMTHLAERKFRGVLTGSELTDVRFSVLTGKAHAKHTVGGDFRQATYRAVRQGLMEAENVLLEPTYDFRINAPQSSLGRILFDLDAMRAKMEAPEIENDTAVIKGSAPVSEIGNYADTLGSFTSGAASLELSPGGYVPCHNAEEIIEKYAYDPEADLRNSPDSVFCSHGAGLIIPWYEVKNHMHVPSPLVAKEEAAPLRPYIPPTRSMDVTGEELDEIFERTFGGHADAKKPGYKKGREKRVIRSESAEYAPPSKVRKPGEKYLIVDGYNIIFAWPELSSLAGANIDSARDRLIDLMSEYNGASNENLTIVFDAYKVPGGSGHKMQYNNIKVVFTKEDETADAYIERAVRQLPKNSRITVATNDNLEQIVVLGGGAVRMTAEELHVSLQAARAKLKEAYLEPGISTKNRLFDNLSDEVKEKMKGLK